MTDLAYITYPHHSFIRPKQLMVLLHGYGSNANDLISLTPDLEEYLPDTIFISPNAPFVFEGGLLESYQWYSLMDRTTEKLAEGYKIAEEILHRFLESQLQKYNLTFGDIILAGFSQGGMMSLQYGLRSAQPLKGVISCSGYLLEDDTLYTDVSSVPILVTHGDMDTIVPFTAHKKMMKRLKRLGVAPVTQHISHGLAHGIDYSCLRAMQKFLSDVVRNT